MSQNKKNVLKKFKVLVIMPKFILTSKRNFNYMLPLGLLYISSSIKKEGYSVDCLNMNHQEGKVSEVIFNKLNNKKYDVICTGLVGGPNYVVVEQIVKSIKDHPSSPKIIMGGALITSEPKLIFNSLNIDFGIRGEGEETIRELLEGIRKNKDLKKIKGIIYKNEKGEDIITPERDPIKDIEKIPYPDFEGFEFKEYLKNLYCNQQAYNIFYDFPRPYPIISSRSCPFHCTFCYHSIGYKYRERSIQNVIEEIEFAIMKYNINIIALYDDMFSFKKERVYQFCKRIKELNKKYSLNLKWFCQLSVVKIDEDMLKTMKDAGCELISYGFESFSPEVLKSMNKPITPRQIDFAIKATQKAKIGIQGNFIFGDVAETKETAKTTLDYWKKNCKGQVVLGFIQPYSGSAIYKNCLKEGIIKNKLEFIKSALEGKQILNMTKNMDNKELHNLAEEIKNLRCKYFPYAVPKRIKKSKIKGYMLKIKCPFCKEIVNYDNYYLQKRFLYKNWIYCRNCKMRFLVGSSILNALREFPRLNFLIEKMFRKIKNLKGLKNTIIF